MTACPPDNGPLEGVTSAKWARYTASLYPATNEIVPLVSPVLHFTKIHDGSGTAVKELVEPETTVPSPRNVPLPSGTATPVRLTRIEKFAVKVRLVPGSVMVRTVEVSPSLQFTNVQPGFGVAEITAFEPTG